MLTKQQFFVFFQKEEKVTQISSVDNEKLDKHYALNGPLIPREIFSELEKTNWMKNQQK